MTSQARQPRSQALERLRPNDTHSFEVPSKRINDGDDLSFFLSSTAYGDLLTWLLQLNRAVFPIRRENAPVDVCRIDSPPPYSNTVKSLQALLAALTGFIDDAPPDTGPRRFGNVAFRTWSRLAEENADSLVSLHIAGSFPSYGKDGDHTINALRDEIKAYLLGSFGSVQRLDYGTGHELSFLAFLACLWKLGGFGEGEERAIVVGVVQPYLELVRKLILTYTLEPAGSHGVWGLDDHSFVPYIFGSAQLGPPVTTPEHPTPTEGSLDTAPEPSSVTSKPTAAQYSKQNMYFSAIQFIYDVKKGPFWEHSPILYDISGIKDGWGKINKGMLKMYAAEVLGKLPVVQHFPFGSFFRWEHDPEALSQERSVHGQQQPVATTKDVPVPSPGGGFGTPAPWAKPAGAANTTTMPNMQASTGMPSMRAPWTANAGARAGAGGQSGVGRVRRPPPPVGVVEQMPAPRRFGEGVPPETAGRSSMPSTSAPWANKDQNR